MLLLLINDDYYQSFLDNKFNQRIKLGEIFNIQVGLQEANYYDFIKIPGDENKSIVFLKPWMFKTKNQSKFHSEVPGKKEPIKSDLQFISEDKIIGVDDYLIVTRGEPCGYSMLEYFKSLQIDTQNKLMVANNHFIKLTPIKFINNMSTGYLHMVLDAMVRIFYDEYLNEISNNQKSKLNTIIQAKTLKEFEITITTDITEQEKAFNTYQSVKQNLEKSKEKYDLTLSTIENHLKYESNKY